MTTCDSPLHFKPLFRQYLWGGRRLADMLGKELGPGNDYAESWEIVDHGQDQSVVKSGSAAGLTLHELVTDHSKELMGRHAQCQQFPLLFKFLDCNRTLSVQVHPNDEQAARLDPPDLGKTEAWVVLAADPGSKIYAGLKEGVTRRELAAALKSGACDRCLHEFEPRVGECIFIRAGTVHALGAGLVIAEIQQASDTTFRLFDWNRVNAQGNPRQLHIEQSLEVTDFTRGPVAPQQPQPTTQPGRERLVECEKFILDRCSFSSAETIGGDDRFHLLVPLAGEVSLSGDTSGKSLVLGQTRLVPAAAGQVEAHAADEVVMLDIYLP